MTLFQIIYKKYMSMIKLWYEYIPLDNGYGLENRDLNFMISNYVTMIKLIAQLGPFITQF